MVTITTPTSTPSPTPSTPGIGSPSRSTPPSPSIEAEAEAEALSTDLETLSLSLSLEGGLADQPPHARREARGASPRVLPDGSGGNVEDEELEKFRAQWRAEVTDKRGVGVRPRPAGNATGQDTKPEDRNKGKDKDKDKDKDKLMLSPTPTKPTKLPLSSPISPKKFLTAYIDEEDDGPSELGSGGAASSVRSRPQRYVGSTAPPTTFPTLRPNEVGSGSTRTRTPAQGSKEAVQIYARAVESEQSGQLNEALMLYRRAFKIDDDVDRSYAGSLAKPAPSDRSNKSPTATKVALPPTPSSADIISSAPPSVEPYSFARHIQVQPDYDKASAPSSLLLPPSSSAAPSSVTGSGSGIAISPLTKMLNALPVTLGELAFLPQEEELPNPISKLPNELFEPILSHLDVASIERFGSTCWKARYLTHVSYVWRRIAQRIYRPPAMLPLPDEEVLGREEIDATAGNTPRVDVRDLVSRHRGEWRTTVVEEERVRMDGCYIAVCHYIRPGAGEEWVSITHMITYHRFLRFYPDGAVISFLTTDHPSEIVPVLRPSLRSKGLHFGRWKLLRSDSPCHPHNLAAQGLAEPETNKGKKGLDGPRIVVTDLLEPGTQGPKYEFEMDLALRSTGRGRWNKLDIIEYRSINLLTGEVLALPLKHQKPFYFSKVRSYNPPL